MKTWFKCLTVFILACLPSLHAAVNPRDSAAVFYDLLPGQDRTFANELVGLAKTAGYTPELIGLNVLTNATVLKTDHYGLLILPNARRLPAAATRSIEGFLKSGGNLLALGVPAWKPGLFQVGANWFGRAEYEEMLQRQKPQHLIENFAQAELAQWRRSSDQPEATTRWELVSEGADRALHVRVENYTGWDTLGFSPSANPFPAGHTLTCFRAKAAPQTKQISLEWQEADGSRWIATVNLTTNWQHFALPPEAFKAWQPPASRGGAQDHLIPAKAVRFTIGVAVSHTSNRGRLQEYWLDDLGTAPNPLGDAVTPGFVNHPHLEAICPDYLFFPITTATLIKTPDDLALTGALKLAQPMPPGLYGFHPRQQGEGYDQQRPWRWQPLLEARDRNGDYRGAVGVWMAHCSGPYQGAIWATFTPEAPAFYQQKEMRAHLQDALAAMRRGLFLKDGGSEFFTAFDGQSIRLGATVVNFGWAQRVGISIQVQPANSRQSLFARTWQTNLAAGAVIAVEQVWKPASWPTPSCRVTVELTQNGKVIDRLSHELNVWRPKAKPEFVSIQNGEFRLNGRPWKAHGVNYMPSTGIGLGNEYFEHWIGRGGYDPEVIQRDLARIKNMGLNSVSAFIYYRSLKAQHLLDFLFRCDKLGLKVNLSLRPGTPMEFRWDEMKALIEHYRLAQNDSVLAYDLAWEPSHYDHNYQQKYYQAPWQRWVMTKHGTLAQAEAFWKFSVPRQGQTLDVPAGEHLVRDGPWRGLIADYRQFLDEWLRQHYAETRRLVKTIDPHHPVSFRMQFAGDPTLNTPSLLPYDLYSLRQAVDIWAPEAYGRIGDWERVRPGHFTAAYARLCNPALPVMWAEMGNSVWDMQTMAPSPEKLSFTAQYYRDFYRLLTESGADGISFWWYPGGYRLNENSDYGIINPDGTDREITQVIRTEGTKYLRAPKPPPPNYWLSVDRDRDARGLNGIYEAVKAEYWQAIGEGKQPGLKWVKLPGQK